MKSSSIRRTSWHKVGLAILPGIWLIFQQNKIIGQTYIEVSFVILMTISLVLIGKSLWLHRHLAPWCWPVFGALLWDGWYLYRTSPYWRLMWPLVMIISYLICGVMIYWFWRRFRNHMPPWGWIGISLLVIVTITIAYSYNSAILFTSALLNLLPILLPIIIGLLLARRYGLVASLFVVAFEPALIDILFIPEAAVLVQLQELSTLKLELASFILTYISFLSFLIIIPIGLLRTNSIREQWAWLSFPSLLTLAVINLTRGLALTETDFEYSLNEWVRYSLVVIQLWLPLLITGILYSNVLREHLIDVDWTDAEQPSIGSKMNYIDPLI